MLQSGLVHQKDGNACLHFCFRWARLLLRWSTLLLRRSGLLLNGFGCKSVRNLWLNKRSGAAGYRGLHDFGRLSTRCTTAGRSMHFGSQPFNACHGNAENVGALLKVTLEKHTAPGFHQPPVKILDFKFNVYCASDC